MVNVPTFRRRQPPRIIQDQRDDSFRGSRHDRGYDARWVRLAERLLRENPLCAECERHDFICLADVVDHIIPVRDDPTKRLDRTNLQSLCNSHHNGWKRRIEAYARRRGLIGKLAEWCANIASRPKRFASGDV